MGGTFSRRDRSESGFTLVELLVVVLVIAVLILVAIPAFLGTRDRANDRVVQSNVRNAFAATRIYYAEKQRYTESPAEMTAIEPSLQWTNAALTNGDTESTVTLKVYDVPSTAQTVVVTGRTKTGRCFFLKDVMGGDSPGTYYSRDVSTGASCPSPAPGDASWTGAWPNS